MVGGHADEHQANCQAAAKECGEDKGTIAYTHLGGSVGRRQKPLVIHTHIYNIHHISAQKTLATNYAQISKVFDDTHTAVLHYHFHFLLLAGLEIITKKVLPNMKTKA